MSREQLFADDFQVITGETSINLDFSSPDVQLDLTVSSDGLVKTYAVGASCVVPLDVSRHFRMQRVLHGFTGLQFTFEKKSQTTAISCKVADVRNGQRVDPTKLVIPIDQLPKPTTMNAAIRAMVRQQLLAAGFNPDGDVDDFKDGDLSFDGDDDDFGGSDYYDDDPEVAGPPPGYDRGADRDPAGSRASPPEGEAGDGGGGADDPPSSQAKQSGKKVTQGVTSATPETQT